MLTFVFRIGRVRFATIAVVCVAFASLTLSGCGVKTENNRQAETVNSRSESVEKPKPSAENVVTGSERPRIVRPSNANQPAPLVQSSPSGSATQNPAPAVAPTVTSPKSQPAPAAPELFSMSNPSRTSVAPPLDKTDAGGGGSLGALNPIRTEAEILPQGMNPVREDFQFSDTFSTSKTSGDSKPTVTVAAKAAPSANAEAPSSPNAKAIRKKDNIASNDASVNKTAASPPPRTSSPTPVASTKPVVAATAAPETAKDAAASPKTVPGSTPKVRATPLDFVPFIASAKANDSTSTSSVENEQSALTAKDSGKGYAVVKIFYGTDRASADFASTLHSAFWGVVSITVIVALASIAIGCMAVKYFIARWTKIIAVSGSLVATVAAALISFVTTTGHWPLAGSAATAAYSYGNQRGSLELGTCEVSIPQKHQTGELEAPSLLRFEFSSAPGKYVTLLGVNRETTDDFYADMKATLGKSKHKSVFVFVHGYNVTFEDAARRTAQIAYDLKFDGAPVLYSWPSQGGLLQYAVDETNVAWTVPHLKQFLTEVAQRAGADQVHLIAHSMGNRALTEALRDLAFLPDDARPKFSEVLLTAPDIDADVFKSDIAPAVVKTAKRVTLYASSNDEALAISKTLHGYPRAGDGGRELVVVNGLETIDVSEVDTSFLGHSYYGDSDSVLSDMCEIICESKPADVRSKLKSALLGAQKYWVFRR